MCAADETALSRSRWTVPMGRRYRRLGHLTSVVGDVVDLAFGLPWWGALLVGLSAYFLFSVVLAGFVESRLLLLEGSAIQAVAEVRLSRIARACGWVGLACLFASLLIAVRNYFISDYAPREERGFIAFVAKLFGRGLD